MARRAGDPPHLIGSPKRINEEMGWHAKYNVEGHCQVRLGCLAGQPGAPHRRRHLEADRLRFVSFPAKLRRATPNTP